jgi:hypothetical protein
MPSLHRNTSTELRDGKEVWQTITQSMQESREGTKE